MTLTTDFDKYWRTEAIKIAMHEQLNINDELDFDALFKRAKYIYIQGYKNNIHKWDELAKSTLKITKIMNETEEDEPIKEEIKPVTEIIKDIPDTMKQCPACGELVNKGWVKHAYKSNGEKCGHVFSQQQSQ